jgi:uncharacterized membrane protein YidH (DUF202 family)
LEDRGRVVFLHPLADQRCALGAYVAQLRTAIAEDGNGVCIEWVGRLEPQFDQVTRRAHHALHLTVALTRVLVREVDANNRGSQFINNRIYSLGPGWELHGGYLNWNRHRPLNSGRSLRKLFLGLIILGLIALTLILFEDEV